MRNLKLLVSSLFESFEDDGAITKQLILLLSALKHTLEMTNLARQSWPSVWQRCSSEAAYRPERGASELYNHNRKEHSYLCRLESTALTVCAYVPDSSQSLFFAATMNPSWPEGYDGTVE